MPNSESQKLPQVTSQWTPALGIVIQCRSNTDTTTHCLGGDKHLLQGHVGACWITQQVALSYLAAFMRSFSQVCACELALQSPQCKVQQVNRNTPTRLILNLDKRRTNLLLQRRLQRLRRDSRRIRHARKTSTLKRGDRSEGMSRATESRCRYRCDRCRARSD